MKSGRTIAEKVLQVAAPGLVEGRETLLNEIAGAVEVARSPIAEAWSILTGWDAVRLENGTHLASHDPGRALVDAARAVVKERDDEKMRVKALDSLHTRMMESAADDLARAQKVVDTFHRERDEARAEVERLRDWIHAKQFGSPGPCICGLLSHLDSREAHRICEAAREKFELHFSGHDDAQPIGPQEVTAYACTKHDQYRVTDGKRVWCRECEPGPAPLPHLADALADVPSHAVPSEPSDFEPNDGGNFG